MRFACLGLPESSAAGSVTPAFLRAPEAAGGPTRWDRRSGPRIPYFRLTVAGGRPHSPRQEGTASALGSGSHASAGSQSLGGRRHGASKANSYHVSITPMRPGLPRGCAGPNGGSGKEIRQQSTHRWGLAAR